MTALVPVRPLRPLRTEETIGSIYARRRIAFRLFQRRCKAIEAALAPIPEDERSALWRRSWARWGAYEAASKQHYDLALHRDHLARGRDGEYLWCQHCKATRWAARRTRARRHTSRFVAV